MQSGSSYLLSTRKFSIDRLHNIIGQCRRYKHKLRLIDRRCGAHRAELRTKGVINQEDVDLIQYNGLQIGQVQSRILGPQNSCHSSRRRYQNIDALILQRSDLFSNAGGILARGRRNKGPEGNRLRQLAANFSNLVGQLCRGCQYEDLW